MCDINYTIELTKSLDEKEFIFWNYEREVNFSLSHFYGNWEVEKVIENEISS